MKRNIKKEAEQYIKIISKQIPKDYPNKTALLNMIRQNMNDFILEHPDCTIDDIIEEFGSSAELTAYWMEEMPDSDLVATLQKSHRSFIILLIACLICFAVFFFTSQYVRNWYINDALIVEETLYVTDETEFPSEWEEKFNNGVETND